LEIGFQTEVSIPDQVIVMTVENFVAKEEELEISRFHLSFQRLKLESSSQYPKPQRLISYKVPNLSPKSLLQGEV
jgi:hypothetical protein